MSTVGLSERARLKAQAFDAFGPQEEAKKGLLGDDGKKDAELGPAQVGLRVLGLARFALGMKMDVEAAKSTATDIKKAGGESCGGHSDFTCKEATAFAKDLSNQIGTTWEEQLARRSLRP